MAKQYLPIDEGDFEKRLQQLDQRLDALEGGGGGEGGDASGASYETYPESTLARTDKERWNDHINITDIAPVDVTGGQATAHTAIMLAWQKAIGRNRRGVIHLPPGNLRCGDTLELRNAYLASSTVQRIELAGAGKHATSLIGPTNGKPNLFGIGANTDPASGYLTFRDFTVVPTAAATTALSVHNAVRCYFQNIFCHLFKYFYRSGTDPNQVSFGQTINFMHFFDCGGSVGVDGVFFYPVTVQVLQILGGEYAGAALPSERILFKHDSIDFNIDGLYIHPGHTEQIAYVVHETGLGIVNCRIGGESQFDRAISFIYVKPAPAAPTSGNRDWNISDVQMLQASSDGIVFDIPDTHICEAINISGLNMLNTEGRILYVTNGAGTFANITARGCAPGKELIRLGTKGNFQVNNVQAHKSGYDQARLPPTYGIMYDGPSTGKRGHQQLNVWETSVGLVSGTP